MTVGSGGGGRQARGRWEHRVCSSKNAAGTGGWVKRGRTGTSFSTSTRLQWGVGGASLNFRKGCTVRERWVDGEGRLLQAILDGDVAVEGRPHSSSMDVTARGREVPTDSFSACHENVTGGFVCKGEGAQQIAGLSSTDVQIFARRGPPGFQGKECTGVSGSQGGSRISIAGAPHAVRGGRQKNIGHASLRRTNKLVYYL